MAQEIYHRSEWGNPTETWGNVYLNADLTNELYKRASEYENSWVTDQLLNGVGTKPSIILTPTAYEDGVLNSVKPAKTFGSELVTNGSFDTDSDWSKGTGWSISGGKAIHTGAQSLLSQSNVFTIGNKYKISFDLSDADSSNYIRLLTSHYVGGGNYSTNGTQVVYVTSNITQLYIYGVGDVTIDNVSVKEITEADFDFTRGSSATRVNELGLVQDVQLLSGELVQNGNFEQIGSELVVNGGFDTDSDWSKGTGWSIANGSASYDGSGTGYQYILQSITTTSGSIYKINFDVLSSTGSNLNIVDFGSVRVNQSHLTEGNYTFYAQADSSSENIIIYANGTDTFSIDNVSVKEVGQNWTFSDGATITGNGARIVSDGAYQRITQNNILTVGKQYKLQYEIVENNSGNLKVQTSLGIDPIPTTVGTHTVYGQAAQTYLSIERSGACDITITNISVIEITNDTDIPRIDYTTGFGSWLLEPQSTNLIPYSEDFSGWNSYQATSNTTTSPSGSTVYFLDFEDARMYPTTSISSSTTYTSSIYLKANKVANVKIRNARNEDTVISLTTDWVRYEVTAISNSSSTNALLIDARFSEGLGASGLEIALWGAQIEALSYATSYIVSNSGSTTTRSAETATNSGNADLINSTEGVLYAEISALADDLTNRSISISDGSTNNRVNILYADATNQIRVIVVVDGSTKFDQNYNVNSITDIHKIAVKYKADDFALWVDGVERATDTSGTIFTQDTLNELAFNIGGNLFPFYGNVKELAVFKEALTDAELESLTSWISFTEMATDLEYTVE